MDWFPLWLSLGVAAAATLASVVIGTFLAWLLAGGDFKGKCVIEAIVELPLLLPPTVIGYYLLVIAADGSPLGRLYASLAGKPLLYSWQAAVVASVLYAAPWFVKSIQPAFEAIHREHGPTACGLGASRCRFFFYVALPLAAGQLAAASLLVFVRSMAEFGATLMAAGNLPGKTQTLSVAVYDAVSRADGAAARNLTLIASLAALAALYAARKLRTQRAVS